MLYFALRKYKKISTHNLKINKYSFITTISLKRCLYHQKKDNTTTTMSGL